MPASDSSSVEVLYAVNASEYYQQLATYSLLSLRALSKKQKITVCVFGRVFPCLRGAARHDPNTRIIALKAVNVRFNCGTVLKWIALAYAKAPRVLFVDADTLFMESPERLLKEFKKADIYADVERGTTGDWWRGRRKIRKRIDDTKMRRILKNVDAQKKFVPFTGFMLFNHFSYKKILEELPLLLNLYFNFFSGKLTYPCTLLYMADEVAAGIVFGRFPSLKFAHFKSSTITHLNDWLPKPGEFATLLHLGNQLAPMGYRFLGYEDIGNTLADLRKRQ